MTKHGRKRIGIAGLGDIASKAYAPILASHRDAELVGVMSRTKAKVDMIADQYRIPGRYVELQDLLDQKLDAIFIHSSTESHEQLVSACLERDIAVYVDKPLSYSIAASERMAELAQKRGILLAVGFNRRFAPRYMEVKQWLEQSEGFDLCVLQKHRTSLQTIPAHETLYDDLIHMIDLMLWFGATTYQTESYMQNNNEDGRLQQAAGTVAFQRDQGAGKSRRSAAFFSMNRCAGADIERVEVHGNGCSVEVVNLESAIWQRSGPEGGRDTRAFTGWNSIGERRGFAGAIQHFLDTIDEPARCAIKAQDVLETHRLVERFIQMAK